MKTLNVMLNRRSFLFGATSTAAVAGTFSFAGCLAESFVASGAPDLRIGVLSDVHLGENKTIENAFRYFFAKNVDGVVIAGDIANNGKVVQLEDLMKAWRAVFPEDRAADGRSVAKLFVNGNHDTWGDHKDPAFIDHDRPGVWERVIGEKYAPIWIKQVKGFTFIGAHWREWESNKLADFLKAHDAEINKTRPFFYIQHAHPGNTCMGTWAWGHDRGISTAALSKYPTAVAFTGHSHYSLTDERSVWQGAFTSINAGCLRYTSYDYSLRENMSGNTCGYKENRTRAMAHMSTDDGRQGMVLSVYGDKLVFERRDFLGNKSLGPDWAIDVPPKGDCSFAARAAKRSAPEFAAGAVVTAKVAEKTVTVGFPAARTVNGCRVYEYEVSAVLAEDDVDLVQAQRRVMAPDFHLPETPEGRPGTCVFNRAELPLKGHYIFRVRPIECYGKKGEEIASSSPISIFA